LALMDDVFAILVSSGIAIRSTHFLWFVDIQTGQQIASCFGQ
jgi:hypothetical protein